MFTTKSNEVVGFESQWKVKKVTVAGAAQTDEKGYSLVDITSSTATTAEIMTQTDKHLDDEEEIPNVDMQKLADWLKNIYPSVKRELDEGSNSKAFRNYRPSTCAVEANVRLKQKIQVPNEDTNVLLKVASITSNTTGKVVAVTCNHEHRTWCHHIGVVFIYDHNRFGKLDESPSRKLTAQTCLSVLKFHSVLPNIIAGGTHAGDILIWDIQHSDVNVLLSKVISNEQAISQISWIQDIDQAKTILLASSSLDGFLNLWRYNQTTGNLSIKQKYNIKPPLLGRVTRETDVPEEISSKAIRGVICFDFSPYISEMFVVGVEGGLIVQCSMLGTHELKGSSADVPLADPVYRYYKPHEGEVTSISFSVNRKEMFMSSGSEGEIHIYILDQDEPAQVIFLEKSLTALSWIPFEEKIVCGCGSKGTLEIFNLLSGRPLANVVKDALQSSTLTAMELNKKWPMEVITGDDKGSLEVWSAPWNTFTCNI